MTKLYAIFTVYASSYQLVCFCTTLEEAQARVAEKQAAAANTAYQFEIYSVSLTAEPTS